MGQISHPIWQAAAAGLTRLGGKSGPIWQPWLVSDSAVLTSAGSSFHKQNREELLTLGPPQLKGPLEVLHTARVRCDWQGGKLDLAVRQGDTVEILRAKDNPGGKWLVRAETGRCES